MARPAAVVVMVIVFLPLLQAAAAQLRRDYYAGVCPDVESIVRAAVAAKVNRTAVTIPATLRLLFHDCMVNGCDASVMIASTSNNTAEKDAADNLSLAGDGFDTVIRAKEAVDAVEGCAGQVSCADILVMAARDVVSIAGGPSYAVELGRLDGLVSTSASVAGRLPGPEMNITQLTAVFAAANLSQADMIALSAAHTVGFSHCSRFANRIYNFSRSSAVDPTMRATYVAALQKACPPNVNPSVAVQLDLITPMRFDNQYYKNLQSGMGLLTSDQELYTGSRETRLAVDTYAYRPAVFSRAFVAAMTNLGRVGVKTAATGHGNIRHNCAVFNP